jgi:hypothetical protein
MPFTLDLVVDVIAITIIVIVIRILVNDIKRRTTVGAVKVSQNTSGSLIIVFFVNFALVSAVIQANDLWHYGAMVVVLVIRL